VNKNHYSSGGPEGDTVTVDEQLLNTEYIKSQKAKHPAGHPKAQHPAGHTQAQDDTHHGLPRCPLH